MSVTSGPASLSDGYGSGIARWPLAAIWQAWNAPRLLVAPPHSQWPSTLRRARRIGFGLLALQLVALGLWTALLAHRYALTYDFSGYQQGTFLISRGNLNPPTTTWGGYSLAATDGEFIFWPFGLLESIWPHPITLKLIQDVAIVGAEAIAFAWICEIAARRASDTGRARLPIVLVGLAALLLVADPWAAWTASFDVHSEPFAGFFLIGTARDLHRGRRTVWLWAGMTLVCGAVGASYLGALGVGMLVSGRCRWRRSLIVAIIGFSWLLLVSRLFSLHGTAVSSLYGPLLANSSGRVPANATDLTLARALLAHPIRFLDAFLGNRVNYWATLAPLGLLGVLWLPALVPALFVLAEGGLVKGASLAFPGVQNNALAPLVVVGTVIGCLSLSTRLRQRPQLGRRLITGLLGLICVNAAGWAIVWLPETSTRWLRVDASTARALAHVNSLIHRSDEVVASQGVSGGFSDHRWVYQMVGGKLTVPVRSRSVWFVLTPYAGIEVGSSAVSQAILTRLTRMPGAQLEWAGNGVWAYRVNPPPAVHRLTFPGGEGADDVTEAAWSLAGAVGRSLHAGAPSNWRVTNDGRAGYVMDRAQWPERPGRYTARVSLDVRTSANIEVWDDTSDQLLARRTQPATNGRYTVRIPVTLQRYGPEGNLFSGWGPWTTRPYRAAPADTLEIRVYAPADPVGSVSVYSAGLHPDG